MLVTHHIKPGVTAIALIHRTPDAGQKLQILAGMPAADDILSRALYGRSKDDFRLPYFGPEKDPLPGVYRVSMPNGKIINLIGVSGQLEMPWPGHRS